MIINNMYESEEMETYDNNLSITSFDFYVNRNSDEYFNSFLHYSCQQHSPLFYDINDGYCTLADLTNYTENTFTSYVDAFHCLNFNMLTRYKNLSFDGLLGVNMI